MTVVEGRALDGQSPAIGPTPSDQFVPRLTAASVDLEDTVMPPNGPRRPSIPNGWISARIRDVAPLQRGFDLPTSNIRPGRHPVAYSNGILQYHERAMVAGPGVVTGRSGTIGKVQFIESDYWPHNTALWVKSFYENDPKFIYYLYTHVDLSQLASGSGVPTLNRNDVHQRWVSCPPVPEQRAIAEALSDVDDLLRSLESLIAKKQAVKQAAMQKLLTGEIRLPGFSEEWKKSRLGEIASVRDRKVLPSHMSPDTLCIELDHIGQENGRLAGYSTAEFSTSSKYHFFAGDVLFGRLRSYLRKYWHADRNGICTTEIWPLMADPEQIDSGFLYTLVQTERFMEAASVSYGTHMPRAEWSVVRGFEFSLPPLEEQRSIARVHLDMDAEIDALEQRRDKTRALKQGMMQQLLTGKIRLVDSVQTTMGQASSASTGKGHNWQINEAVVISVLAGRFGNEEYPLGRMRYTKLSYLFHRHAEGRAEDYLKKAAGPYNPRTRYGGPEKIALGKSYVRKCTSGKYQGFIAGDNAEESERYFDRWYGREALQWLEQFRYKKNNDLELLTTVDMAIEELHAEGEAVSIESVREVIHRDPEWTKKLARPTFSSANLERAIGDCEQLFGR